MIAYPSLDPEIVRLGPVAIRWYGVMYLIGFVSSYLLVKAQIKKRGLALPADFLDSLYTSIILGLVLGARLGYVLFYDLSVYLNHLGSIFAVWQGGMSFHGGLIGSVVAGIWCCKKFNVAPWIVADLVMATAPIGLGMGRIGNFINGELYGRMTDVPWGMIFPNGGPFPRHPSQLYEFLLEGVVLFSVLWTIKGRLRVNGALSSLFVILYGVIRIIVEFFREPDVQLGFVVGPFTMGQVLSACMVLGGIGLLLFLSRNRASKTAL